MPTPVIMPKLGMTMEEGTVIQWFKKEGDHVEKGEPLLEIMTDKVNAEVESPATGVLWGISARPDTTVPVAQVIAYILATGESLPESGRPASPPAMPSAVSDSVREAPPDERVSASPLARRLAREAGLDLRTLKGTGPKGRIVEADVQAALKTGATSTPIPAPPPKTPPSPTPASAVTPTQVTPGKVIPVAGKRKIIAERMTASALVPQFALGLDADMTRAEEARGDYSVTAFLVRVVAQALRHHPFVNAAFRPDGIHLSEDVNIGVAVSAEDGLVVPVVKQADRKNLAVLDQELKDLAARARSGTLLLDDVTGATFTISNLGMFGIEEFKALINPPEAAILATGRITPKPVVLGGAVVVRPMLHLVLSADHRVLDGATAAAFLTEVKSLLENPYHLL